MEWDLILLVEAGVVSIMVGLLTGLFGVGGGFLLSPLMMIFLGLSPEMAVGTSLCVILLSGTTSLITRHGTGTVDGKLALWISGGSALGVFSGQHLLALAKSLPPLLIGGRSQNAAEYFLLAVFMLFLVGVMIQQWSDATRPARSEQQEGSAWLARLRVGPHVAFKTAPQPLSLPALLGIAACGGLLMGFLGVGGGLIWIPVLIYLVRQELAAVFGTSLLVLWLASLGGTALAASQGHVHWILSLIMLGGTVAGSWQGTRLGLRWGGKRLKKYFVLVLLAAFVVIGLRLLAMTFGW